MSDKLKIEIETITIVHIIAIILALVFLMMFYMRANRNTALKWFLILQISIIGWMVFKIFKTVSPTELSRWWFIVGYYFCACVFEVAFLNFTYAYYKNKEISHKIRRFIYILPIAQFLCILTNPYHHLFYASYDFWGDSFGILFYFHTAIEYCFVVVAAVYGTLVFRRQFKNKKLWYKYLIASTILMPLVLNILFITKVLHHFLRSVGIHVVFDITPIVFVWSILVFVYATLRHDFLNLSPIMKHEIVHKLDSPICVLDSSFEVVYLNEKLSSLFENQATEITTNAFAELDLKRLKNSTQELQIGQLAFTIYIREVKSIIETQYLITMRNITDYKNAAFEIEIEQEELAQSNSELQHTINLLKQTSKIGARNYVARELHDIIGHSLVVSIKLLEVAKLYFQKDFEMTDSALADACTAIQSGIDNMSALSASNTIANSLTGEQLEKDLDKMLQQIKNVEINFKLHFKGAYFKIEETTYDIILKVCTELVTNSLKHAQAKELFISVNNKSDDIDILVMDNGIGCARLNRGNGLNSIESRLRHINGKIDFITSSDDGFMSRIHITK